MKIIITILLCCLSFSLKAITVVHTNPFPNSIVAQANSVVAGSGDGLIPIIYKDRIYIINHHASLLSKSFNCVNKDGTGNSKCAIGSATWPQNLPDGDTNTIAPLFSATSGVNEEFSIINGKLYYSVTRYANNAGTIPQDWGVGCYDLDTHSECGYTALSTNPNNRSFIVAVEGPFQNDGKLYFLDLEMNLYCFDPSNATICGNLDLSLSSNGGMAIYTMNNDTQRRGQIGGEVVNDNLYLTVVFNVHPTTAFLPLNTVSSKYAMCIDISTGLAPCSSWIANGGAQRFTSYGAAVPDNHSNFIFYLNAATKTPLSLCNYGSGTLACLSLSNGSVVNINTDPVVSYQTFQSLINPPAGFGLGVETTIWPRTYFPDYFGTDIECYDWLSASPCAGYPKSPPATITSPFNYALSFDDAGCVWVNGHKNKIWSMNPLTGTSPCNLGSFAEIVPKPCSQDEWQAFDISGITAADFQSLELKIKNASGVWIVFDLLNTNLPINLNTPDFKNLNLLEYEIKASLNATTFTTQPIITISSNNNSNGVCNVSPPAPVPALNIWSLLFLAIILWFVIKKASLLRSKNDL